LPLKVCKLVITFGETNLGSRGLKMGFWGENWGVPEREQPRTR